MLGRLAENVTSEREGRPALRVLDERETAFRRLADRQLDGAYRLAAVILGDAGCPG